MNTIDVNGSYGTLLVDADTGNVIVHQHDGDYADIRKFDLEEWKRTYPDEDLVDGDALDMLDVAFWTHDGAYWRSPLR